MPYAEKRGDGEYPWRVRWPLPPDGSGQKRYDGKPGFATEGAALEYGREREQEQAVDLRRGVWRDPRKGDVTLERYWERWIEAQDIGDKSRENRLSQWRTHIKPRFGATPLRDIDPLDVAGWEKQLRKNVGKSWADHTVELLRLMLGDAVPRLIPMSPVQPKPRRGTRPVNTTRPGMVVDLATVLALRDRLTASEALLVVTTAFTGMRFGEAIGIRRSFLTLAPAKGGKPAHGQYVIDDKVGAVHEDQQGLRAFGPPKGGRGRTVELPPFLVTLLLAHLKTFPPSRDLLFVTRGGVAMRRTQWTTRVWRPACDGWEARDAIQGRVALLEAAPVAVGLHFHDLRHTHKTWLADDGADPVARDERLGHLTPGMDGIYIHPTAAMRATLLAGLQRRWEDHARRSSPIPLPFEAS